MKTQLLPSPIYLGCSEIQIRYTRPVLNSMVHLLDSKRAAAFIRTLYSEDTIDYKEYFWVVHLSSTSRVLGVSNTSIGNFNGTVFSVREVVQQALLLHSVGVIIAHNHPGGSKAPSQEDHKLTETLKDALKLIEVTLMDHIILTSETYTSMADYNYL